MIPVTKPFLPPQEAYNTYVEKIWKRNWLTNNGPLVQELETKLKHHLNIDHFLFLTNGTLALQLAIKALNLKGEIITTPFSFVATTCSIVWEHCTPIFVDIDKQTYNIDPAKIEAAITPKTSAIIATHVFGNPCAVEQIQAIADKHQLKVIYDAAHCFDVQYKGKSILEYGDISTISFHATKLYHTIEGGGISVNTKELEQKIRSLRNFGYEAGQIKGLGINAKNSEFHAAMGLVNLKFIKLILNKRKKQYNYYLENLANTNLGFQKITNYTDYNYSYFPIVMESETALVKMIKAFSAKDIYPRRYFYPALHQLSYTQSNEKPIDENISSRILCLPLYHTLQQIEQDQIIELIVSNLSNQPKKLDVRKIATPHISKYAKRMTQ